MSEMPPLDPASPRAQFGAEMRRLREAAGLPQSAVARRLGCTQTQVSRLEKGTRTPSRRDAETLDELFGDAVDVSFVRRYERIRAQPGSPVWFRSWAEEIEATATVLRLWDPLLIPGLLQTEAYARCIFSHGPQIAPNEVEEHVRARMQRQRIFARQPPPTLLALMDEGVIRRRIGSPELMRDQLAHLLKMAQQPSVFIQLVDAECVAGLGGTFAIAELPDGLPTVVQADSVMQGHITTDHDLVTSAQQRYEAIRLWAYPERISLKMIEEARQEWT